MKINLSYVELHAPLFLAGKNFGHRLAADKLTGISMVYDRAEKEILITWNHKTCIVPWGNCVTMIEA